MKILLTGATGYIGKRLLPVLIKNGHEVVCCVRDKSKFHPPISLRAHIRIIEIDLNRESSLARIPKTIDAAYYLVHSMSSSKDYAALEQQSANNFKKYIQTTNCKQVIYLSGIVNANKLSKHLRSRQQVANTLANSSVALTTLRAGIIIGSGSASFEIIRDLVEKLPIMVAPKWLQTKCQPIGITDVIDILHGVLGREETYHESFDIGSREVLTYKQMLLQHAEVRGLKRSIYTVPVMTPKLSSYWLYFITSTSYKLACSLVDSMKVEVVAEDLRIYNILQLEPESYKQSVAGAFKKIAQNEIVSSWKDSTVSGRMNFKISDYIQVPIYGCFKDNRACAVSNSQASLERIWKIGGATGWYYGNWLWRLRGFIDKLYGGVGLRRGRTNVDSIHAGDTLDFWRVLYANASEKRLLLFAEMRLPGEAWLEFHIQDDILVQTATFRPKGLWGRLYWYAVLPFHGFIFNGMLRRIAR